ncbi:glycoside hydrolase family 88/105 protein, partial [Streptomyces sp. NPDC001215]
MRRRLRAALTAGALATALLAGSAEAVPSAPAAGTPAPAARPRSTTDWSVAVVDSTTARYTPSTIGG